MNYVLSGVVLWPKFKFNIPMKSEKILFFGGLFWTRSMQKVSSYGKNQFHLKQSFILLHCSIIYHNTPLSLLNYQILQKMASRHALRATFSLSTSCHSTTKQENCHPDFNILSCLIIWHVLPCRLGCEKKIKGLPLNLCRRFLVSCSLN